MTERISDERLAELAAAARAAADALNDLLREARNDGAIEAAAGKALSAGEALHALCWPSTVLTLVAALRELQALRREREWRPTHRHRKGGLYRFRCHANHAETLEALVIYDDREGLVWARPIAMFEDRERFLPLADEAQP